MWNLESMIHFQEKLGKQFSCAFENVDILELQTFLAVMRMLKLELGEKQPEIYKTLLAILKDYDPAQPLLRESTKRYIRLLLGAHHELSDYIISVLPTVQSATKIHSLSLVSDISAKKDRRDIPCTSMSTSSVPTSNILSSPHLQDLQNFVAKHIPSETNSQMDIQELAPDSARFENKDYLKQITQSPSPPDYANPWGMNKSKTRKRNIADAKKKTKQLENI